MRYVFLPLIIVLVALCLTYAILNTPQYVCTRWEDQGETKCTGLHMSGYTDIHCRKILTCVENRQKDLHPFFIDRH